jgi:hypothetical protein
MAQNNEPVKPPKGHYFLAGRTFPRVKWWKRPNMRLLYFYIAVLIATNTANGFDNSMMYDRSMKEWDPLTDLT